MMSNTTPAQQPPKPTPAEFCAQHGHSARPVSGTAKHPKTVCSRCHATL